METKENALDVLVSRGLLEWCSDAEELKEAFDGSMVTAYVGFDPSADSLHVGNMVPIMGLAWLQRLGHRPIALGGGGTGLIGDPSGKTKERSLLSEEKVASNLEAIKKQLAQFLDFERAPNGALLLNNGDWLVTLKFIEFLRDIGKYFPVSFLVNREYVRSRVEDADKSITYTELSYILLQAYDFNHLYNAFGCTLQMGGNDQQVNIIAGMDLIRKKSGGRAYGATFPLLLTSSGQKFGKSEQGAIYLSPERTSPYQFYQFWVNTEDSDVEKLFKLFTFLPLAEIERIVASHGRDPQLRAAQKQLAWDVTCRVHGEEIATRVREASALLFGELDIKQASEDVLDVLAREVPFAKLNVALPLPLVDVLVASGLKECASKGAARRKIREGGVYLNGVRVTDEAGQLGTGDLLAGGHVLLRVGKKDYCLVKIA